MPSVGRRERAVTDSGCARHAGRLAGIGRRGVVLNFLNDNRTGCLFLLTEENRNAWSTFFPETFFQFYPKQRHFEIPTHKYSVTRCCYCDLQELGWGQLALTLHQFIQLHGQEKRSAANRTKAFSPEISLQPELKIRSAATKKRHTQPAASKLEACALNHFFPRLMLEVPNPREDERHPVLVAARDGVLVPDTASRLSDDSDAVLARLLNGVIPGCRNSCPSQNNDN